MDNNNPRTDLAEKAYKLALVGIPLLTAILNLISKVVNYKWLLNFKTTNTSMNVMGSLYFRRTI